MLAATRRRRVPADEDGRAPSARCALVLRLVREKLNVISALTTQHIRHVNGQTPLALGSRPVVLPAPLYRLVNELADATGHTPARGLINAPSRWLFPGRLSGVSEDIFRVSRAVRPVDPPHRWSSR
ncbi:hypothetical protein [Dactylosporangium roseum]|uniref:hypothetical protein n=1 Tax=Dactylosporangium roseum TaxID=47989 RepID=UPI0021B32FC4|nr:hypothetical protein [Dactylosporangium roseum]